MSSDASVSSASSTSSTSTALTPDQLLSKSKSQVTGSIDPNAPTTNGVLSANDLLNRSQDAANGIIDPPVALSSTATSLSAVDKLLQKPTAAAATTDYTDQDWYITAKVAQLKQQLQIYSTNPGLDPSGQVVADLTKQATALAQKQQAKITAQNAQTAATAKAQAAAALYTYTGPSANDLLATVQGTTSAPAASDAVNTLLAQARGGTVNTSA